MITTILFLMCHAGFCLFWPPVMRSMIKISQPHFFFHGTILYETVNTHEERPFVFLHSLPFLTNTQSKKQKLNK